MTDFIFLCGEISLGSPTSSANKLLLSKKKYQARLFVTQRPFMHSIERKPVFDVLTCILHHTTLQEAKNKLIQNGERHLKSIEDLSFIWQDRLDLVEKTRGDLGTCEVFFGRNSLSLSSLEFTDGLNSL